MKQRVFVFLIVSILIATCGVAIFALRSKPFQLVKPDQLTYFRINDDLDYSATSLLAPDVFKEAIQVKGDVPFVARSKFELGAEIDMLMFETLNHIDRLIKRVQYPLFVKYIYGLCGSDFMANKALLGMRFYQRYGASAESMIPRTYLLDNSDDIARLKAENRPDSIYIMKKNVQRQEGYYMTNKLDEILERAREYVVVQQMLQDPFLVNGRKINMRVYMLIVIKNNILDCYYYNNGFMYYTPKEWRVNSMNPDHVITTGYVDRKVYEENPLSFRDLQAHLGSQTYDKLMINIHKLMQRVKMAYQETLIQANTGVPGTKFLVYGCDVAPDHQLNVKLMEINKGPDLSYKDERDKAVKLNMVYEMMGIVGITKRIDNGNFVQV